MSINSVEDAVDVYDRVMGYNIIEDTLELNSIRSGWTFIRKGVRTIVIAPDPTYMDEAVGGIQIAWGFYKMVMGIGDYLGWTEDGEE